jgi:regulator of sigma E protease
LSLSFILYIILALIFIGILVLGHELGHFTLAKINKVMVEEFAIGMGPKLFSIKGKETQYSIRAIPIGGFVKMRGEQEKSSEEGSFSNLSSARKLSIIAAGPFMNFVLAIVLFAILGSSQGYMTNKIKSVMPASPAYTAGLKAGDEIVKIGNSKISTWEDFVTGIYNSSGAPLNITVNRGGKESSFTVTPVKEDDRLIIGVYAEEGKRGLIPSIKYGFNETGFIIKQTVGFFGTLFKGKATANDFGGPVTIIKFSAEAAQTSLWNLVYLMAGFSVQFGIFNIIPFPALDGGYIFIYLFQMITRKEIDENKVGFVNYVGFILLMLLMVAVTVKDIFYPLNL